MIHSSLLPIPYKNLISLKFSLAQALKGVSFFFPLYEKECFALSLQLVWEAMDLNNLLLLVLKYSLL